MQVWSRSIFSLHFCLAPGIVGSFGPAYREQDVWTAQRLECSSEIVKRSPKSYLACDICKVEVAFLGTRSGSAHGNLDDSVSASLEKRVQKNNNGSIDLLPDSLPDLPVSLVLLSLIVVDILEKLRTYPLRGQEKSNEDRHIHTTSLQQIKTVAEQVGQNGGNPGLSQAAKAPGMSQLSSDGPVGSQEPSFGSGILRTMSRRDDRAELFLWSFLRWSDTIEMVRVAGHPAVYKSGWLYPVYIFSYLSVLRIVFTPQNPLLNSLAILLQDLPFVFVRFSLIVALGTITPILGLCKNVLVTLSYVYFNYLTRLRPFSSFETSMS
ncbi:Protein FAM23A [Heterocephalus glaber]|uniref:Protein FAM23A n=1 Tax=Heterocephalus glaber TaxID=10181 RepID=G5BFE1_HETGA|nr:Protein FAM23A [Heterocephalus glaber]